MWLIRQFNQYFKYKLSPLVLVLTMIAMATVHSEIIRATHFHPVEVTIDSKTSVEEFLNKNMGFIQAEMERLDNRRDLAEEHGRGYANGQTQRAANGPTRGSGSEHPEHPVIFIFLF